MRHLSRKRKIIYGILAFFLLALIGLRIALPYVLLRFVNRELTRINGYTGHVDDIDVHLLRGAYTLRRVRLDKTGGKVPVPFFSAETMDLSLAWNALFHGAVEGKIIVDHPTLNFVNGPTEATSETHIDKSWTDVVHNLLPLKLDRFEILEGEIHYRDYYSHPAVDIFTHRVHILAENLSNARGQKELLPSPVDATADVYGGHATLHLTIDALNKVPTFQAKAELVHLELSNLNPFLEAYAGLDVEQGDLGIYTEAAAKDGFIKGYTKPIVRGLKVVNWQKDKDQPLKLLYEGVVSALTWVFKNHGKDQLATRADFQGNLKDPDVDIWYIIGQLLRNAFVQALYPSLDNSVSINSVPVAGGKTKRKHR